MFHIEVDACFALRNYGWKTYFISNGDYTLESCEYVSNTLGWTSNIRLSLTTPYTIEYQLTPKFLVIMNTKNHPSPQLYASTKNYPPHRPQTIHKTFRKKKILQTHKVQANPSLPQNTITLKKIPMKFITLDIFILKVFQILMVWHRELCEKCSNSVKTPKFNGMKG